MLSRLRKLLCFHNYIFQEIQCLNVYNKKPFTGFINVCKKCGEHNPYQYPNLMDQMYNDIKKDFDQFWLDKNIVKKEDLQC